MFFVMQESTLLNNLNVIENLNLGIKCIENFDKRLNYMDSIKKYTDFLDVSSLFNNYPYQLSGGEKRRIEISRAFSLEKKFTFFDEPTGNLDKENRQRFIKLLELYISNNKEKSVIVATHDADLLRVCENVYTIENGKVI